MRFFVDVFSILSTTKFKKVCIILVCFAECKKLDKDCKCSVQGNNACSRIPNSQCDEESDACVCRPFFTPSSKKACESDFVLFTNDGASVDPFTPVPNTRRQFQPKKSVESINTIGVPHNGYVLHVNGTVSTAYYCHLLTKF